MTRGTSGKKASEGKTDKAPGRTRAGGGRARAVAAVAEAAPENAAVRLTEEEQIESAKYLPRDLPPRAFEEERFLFPETYGVNRVRLLVKDPEWLFVHWDVDPGMLSSLRASMGERAVAVSSLTLRISDPGNGGTSIVYLPPGARSWYVQTDSVRRSYQAELGVTLPSGEFRSLAVSNTVTSPRVGASPERASNVISFKKAREIGVPEAAVVAIEPDGANDPAPGPWSAPVVGAVGATPEAPVPGRKPAEDARRGDEPRERGGASETYRR